MRWYLPRRTETVGYPIMWSAIYGGTLNKLRASFSVKYFLSFLSEVELSCVSYVVKLAMVLSQV
jgi:hypothetical protein